MDNRSDIPERVERDRYLPEPKGGGNTSRLAIVIIALAVSVIVSLVMSNFVTPSVSKTDFENNLHNITTDITAIKASVATVTTMQTDVSNLKTTVQTLALKSDLVNLQSQLTAITNQGYAKQSDLTALQNTVNSLNNNLASNKTITDLQGQIKTLSDANSAQDKTIADLQSQLTKLQTQVTTLTSSTTTTTNNGGVVNTSGGIGTGGAVATNGQVTASIISYSYATFFNGNTSAPTVLTFTLAPTQNSNAGWLGTIPVFNADGSRNLAMPDPNGGNATLVLNTLNGTYYWVNNTVTQQFQMQIQNGTGKTISNIQIGVVFLWMGTNGAQVNLPYLATSPYTLSSMGNPQWTDTGDTQQYTSWATGTNNSILGSFWNFTQSPGTSSYYSNLTITLPSVGFTGIPSNPTASQIANLKASDVCANAYQFSGLTWYGVPQLRVVGYTTN